MKFDVKNCWTGDVQFTADIEATDDTPESVKLGRAVVWGHKNGANLNRAILERASLERASLYRANLDGANLDGANLDGANLNRASLDGASLDGASLYGANGINGWIKCIQIETYPICYTAEVMQIGCENHTLDEWRTFDDEWIMRMDGKAALKFWRKYKDWIFATIDLCPAKPTGAK